MHETGFGHRLASYTFEDEELLGAVERLLADDELARGAGLIEQLVRSGAAVPAT
jgi:hypothetical protein